MTISLYEWIPKLFMYNLMKCRTQIELIWDQGSINRAIALQMAIRFSDPILIMGCGNEISPSEDEFDFSLLNNEITSIHKALDDREEESVTFSGTTLRKKTSYSNQSHSS
jgi:hypothetical protein